MLKKEKKNFFRPSLGRIYLASFILLLTLGSYLLFRSDLFTLKALEIKLDKITCASDKQLKESAQILGKKTFFLNQATIEKNIKETYPCVKSVKLSRKFINKILLEVSGREGVAIVVVLKNTQASSVILDIFSQNNATDSGRVTDSAGILQAPAIFSPDQNEVSASFLVDNEGIVFSQDTQGLNYPKIIFDNIDLSLGKKLEGKFENILKILNKVKIFGIDVDGVKIYSQNILLINAMPKMIFALDKNMDLQLASLQLILEQAKIEAKVVEFIDLRFDKPVIRTCCKKNG